MNSHVEPAKRPQFASAGAWAWQERLSIVLLVLLFAALCSYRIHAPGLYYDEMLFVGPAVGQPAYRSWHGLPLMVFPYIGAVKTWIYAPIFALVGVSTLSIRLPAILISCTTLCLGYATMRRVLNPVWAIAFTVACVVDAGLIFQTRLDWGPVVLMLAIKAVCVYLSLGWLGNTRPFSWPLLVACALGFFDKFNFLWFIAALGGATLLVYWREIRAKLEALSKLGATVLAGVGLCGVVVALKLVLPFFQWPTGMLTWARTSGVWTAYEAAITGGTAYLWFKAPPILRHGRAEQLSLQPLVCSLAPSYSSCFNETNGRRSNFLSFASAFGAC